MNYWVGYKLGPAVFSREDSKLLNKKHLLKAQEFYEKYGGKTIILARFVPIIRTFAPFVAGIGQMQYRRFAFYNVIGAVAWVGICVGAVKPLKASLKAVRGSTCAWTCATGLRWASPTMTAT